MALFLGNAFWVTLASLVSRCPFNFLFSACPMELNHAVAGDPIMFGSAEKGVPTH